MNEQNSKEKGPHALILPRHLLIRSKREDEREVMAVKADVVATCAEKVCPSKCWLSLLMT